MLNVYRYLQSWKTSSSVLNEFFKVAILSLVGGRFSGKITAQGFSEVFKNGKRGFLIHMYYQLFRSNEGWWCEPLKIVWKESSRRKGLIVSVCQTNKSQRHLPKSSWGNASIRTSTSGANALSSHKTSNSELSQKRTSSVNPSPYLCLVKNKERLGVLWSSVTAVQPVFLCLCWSHLIFSIWICLPRCQIQKKCP